MSYYTYLPEISKHGFIYELHIKVLNCDFAFVSKYLGIILK